MKIQKIYIGAWFQRTSLHLSEVYDFLKNASSPLELNSEQLKNFRNELMLQSIEMKMGDLEFIEAITKKGIKIKIFEDGLMILGKDFKMIKKDIDELRTYYEKKFSPALNYIFSLGAPIPKELANIKNIYPYFVVLNKASGKNINILLEHFKQEKYFEIKTKHFEIHRGDKLYIINKLSEKDDSIEKFIQEQIFIREFKGQMHRYLNLHRIIWEKIADIKERGEIKGKEVGAFKARIESYGKTINLIETRISQMGTYLHTREAIIKKQNILHNFNDVLEFKYETLADTLSYIQDLWTMTKNYVDSANKIFSDMEAGFTGKSVRDLTIITSMGVSATLINFLTAKSPQFTKSGLIFFLALISVGYLSNRILKYVYGQRKYVIKDIEIDKNIG